MIIYKVHWNDNNGGCYTRCFDTKEDRDNFITRIARRDYKGNWNYTTWDMEVNNE